MPQPLENAPESLLRAVVEASPSGLLMTDRHGTMLLVNREVERVFGYSREELLGQSVELLVPTSRRDAHARSRARSDGAPRVHAMGSRELTGRRKDGSEVPLLIGLTPVQTAEHAFVISAIVDCSDRKRAEAELLRLDGELRQAQKMEALGTMAGSVAHDFNNILSVVVGYVDELKTMVTDETARLHLHEVEQASNLGRDLVRRIMNFARRTDTEFHALDPKVALEQCAAMLRVGLPPRIQLHVRVALDTPSIHADLTSVHLVLMNLGHNAFHALPDGGQVELSAEPLFVHDHVARAHPELREGMYVQLAVRDTGIGMDAATQGKVFEPFFTTKPAGTGTGLGLSTARRILREHGGAIILESAPNEGTRVRCLFPALSADVEVQSATGREVVRGKGEHVLLLDDEPLMLAVGLKQLRRLGYVASGFTVADEALRALSDASPPIAAVLTDYSMPALDGLQFAQRVAIIAPGIPVLMLTGYVPDLADADFASIGVRRVLHKPVSPHELAAALHEVLAAPPDA